MALHRNRLSSALPDGPVPRRSNYPAAPVRAGVCAALLIGVLGTFAAAVFAQFPPPARPPKTAAEAAPKSRAAKPAQLPPARTILDKHVSAIGGRQAILGHTSTHATGTLSMPSAGVTGAVDVFGALPNKTLLKVSLGGVGEVLEGFDGTHGWSISPMTGPMLLEGKQLDEKRFDSEFHSELRSDDRYASLTTLERVDFEGRSCYKLRLVRKTGGEDIEFYDVATGLKAGSITTRETQMGTVTGTTVETDYKKFGNLLQPTTVRSEVGGIQQVITITSVDYDKVPASVFDLPMGIKALLK
jgi:hypothetical protein